MSNLLLILQNKFLNLPPFLPTTLSIMRILVSPMLLNFLYVGNSLSFPLFCIASMTDLLDGKLARKFKVSTVNGQVLDAFADFVFLVGGFSYYVTHDIVSPLLLILMVTSFGYYIYSINKPVQCLIGRYVGTILYLHLAILIIFPYKIVGIITSTFSGIYVLVSIISRLLKLKRMRARNEETQT